MPISSPLPRLSPTWAGRRLRPVLAAFALTLIAASTTRAQNNVTFDGAFTQDDQVQLFQFTVNAPATVTLSTSSFALGGFAPILSLFAPGGAFTGIDSFADPNVGLADTQLQASLSAPGMYTLALTVYDNFAAGPNLSNGFIQQGNGNFTASQFAAPGASGAFYAADGTQKNGSYRVTLQNVAAATAVAAPEPGTVTLLLGGLLIAAPLSIARRRRCRRPEAAA
ncbi:MAG: DVUA0089 family protein [Cytophagales bacterium]|nr:DVUA0089 family protein [Armatimonadota bacterium]